MRTGKRFIVGVGIVVTGKQQLAEDHRRLGSDVNGALEQGNGRAVPQTLQFDVCEDHQRLKIFRLHLQRRLKFKSSTAKLAEPIASPSELQMRCGIAAANRDGSFRRT